jgi:O-antigen ligase
MYWFIILFPLLIYPWGFDPYYTIPKVGYLQMFVLGSWLYFLLKGKYRTINFSKQNMKYELIIVVLFCLVILSTILSINHKTSLYGTKDRYEGLLTYFSYFSIFLFSYRFLDIKKVEKLLLGMTIISIPASVYGILQHYLLDFFPRHSSKLNDPRSYSLFDNANFFGSYLVLIMLLSITLYLTSKSKKLTSFYLISLCLAFTSLLFSATRSGWVGLFCGVVFITFFVVLERKFLWRKWVILLISFGLLMVLINTLENGVFRERMNTIFSDSYKIATNQSTGHEGSFRFFIWEKSIPLINEYIWVGSGPDTFKYVFPNEDKEKQAIFGDMIVDKAHNEYLQLAITLGIPALLTYLLLLLLIVKRGFQAAKRAKGKEKILLFGLLSAIFGYSIQAFFNISVVPVAPLFWSILGITSAKSEIYLKNNYKKDVHNSSCIHSQTNTKNKSA